MKMILHILFSISLLFHLSAYSHPHETIDSLKARIQADSPDTVKLKLLNKIALEFQKISRDSSIHYFNQALGMARNIQDPSSKAEIYTKLGSNYCYKGDYLKALEYLDLADNIVHEFPDPAIQASIHYYKSLVFLHLDKLQEANKHAALALEIYQEQSRGDKVRGIYTLYCYIFEGLEDFEKSLEFSLKSYHASIQLNDTVKIAADLNNVGSRHFLMNNVDSALYYVRQAIILNKKYNNRIWLAINYHNMAEFFIKIQETDSADMYIQKASDLYHEAGHMMNYYLTQEVRGKIALARKDTSAAINYYKSIIDSPRHLDNLKIKTIAYNTLYQIAFRQKRYIEADRYSRSYKTYDDSLKNETNTSLLSVLEMEMEYEKIHSQLELENKEVKLRSQKKNFYIIVLAGLILLLMVTTFFIYRLQKAKSLSISIEKKRIEQELEFKNREMTTNVMSLMKKNEILTDISKSLLDIEKQAVKDETKDALSKIAFKVQKTRDTEIWKEFNVRFKEVHSEFHTKLLRQYPDLSPSEQRLCAFLRMNMSTKDISELSGIHPRSIDNTRSKIRKKLGLNAEDNLVNYLSRI